jgi:V8-like Glu-specific endopeptidase
MTVEDDLASAAVRFEWQRVAELAESYVQFLRSSPSTVSARQAKSVLSLLRENRRYNELLRVADALLGAGVEDAAVKRQFAQALVDRDSPAASLLLFRSLVEDPGVNERERVEALGGMGRCFKQMYVLNTAGARRSRYLQLALSSYREAYDNDHDRVWHGINAVALLARADREGIGLPDVADAGAASRQLAAELLATIESMPEPAAWELATASEACLALERHEESVEWAARFAADRDADPFKIAAVLRQLLEVWQLDTTVPPGSALLPVLRSALLAQDGGGVVVPASDLRDQEASVDSLERVLGTVRYRSLTWFRTGMERCRAVARIETLTEDGVGTGFVVDGLALHPALPDRVLVTNGHVVPEGLDPRESVVVFHGLDGSGATTRHRVVRRWWYAPSATPGLDTSLLEIDDCPPEVVPVPLAAQLPNLGATDQPRAYLIGHPRGLAQPQFTLQDNVLLDYDDVRLHYRSPTEPGSSGSPVFDSQWQLIGLHHAGGFDMPRLHNRGGTYDANEGISVLAIAAALQQRAPVAEVVPQ